MRLPASQLAPELWVDPLRMARRACSASSAADGAHSQVAVDAPYRTPLKDEAIVGDDVEFATVPPLRAPSEQRADAAGKIPRST